MPGISTPPPPQSPATFEDVANSAGYTPAVLAGFEDEYDMNDIVKTLRDLVTMGQHLEECIEHMEQRVIAMDEQVTEAGIWAAQSPNWIRYEYEIIERPSVVILAVAYHLIENASQFDSIS
ncbi:hypothetical protein Clacol_007012 [Clathrus columnatus]|uniref:Uncharacterized protein n=1 Tax=Clathrus columnatus TaxID=1419009 RepID=A0AAV5ADR2_9AGAM|nr:hypothetical protein Clacol_007012 [Clathrus columnatus]